MSTPASPSTPEEPVSRGRYVRLALLILLLGAGLVGIWINRQRPQRLYDEALAHFLTNPAEADRLLEEAIASAGGHFPKAELLRCELLARQGLWDEALGAFGDIREPETLPPHQLAELAEFAKSSQAFLLAELTLKAARHPGPDLPNVLRQSIRLHLESGLEDQAMQECQELLILVPDDAVAWQVQGSILLERKRLPEAEAAFRRAIEHTPLPDPQRPMREQLVRVLLDQGRADNARQELDALISAAPLSPEAKLMDAYADRLLGRWEQAHTTLNWLLENAPTTELQARSIRGMVWLDQGQPAMAVPDLELVIAKQPFNKEAQNKLAQAYRKLNQPEKALIHADAAQHLTESAEQLLDLESKLGADPKNDTLRKRVAELYDHLGQPEKAEMVRHPRKLVR